MSSYVLVNTCFIVAYVYMLLLVVVELTHTFRSHQFVCVFPKVLILEELYERVSIVYIYILYTKYTMYVL